MPEDTNSDAQSKLEECEPHHPLGNWVKFTESLLTWKWFHDSKTVHLFFYLLTRANWKPSFYMSIRIERGQLATGLFRIQKDTGLSIQSIRTCLKRLKSTNELTIKSTNKFSIITLCNYDLYHPDHLVNQQTTQQADQQSINKQVTNEQQHPKKNKNSNNSKKNKNPVFDPTGKTKYLDWVYLSDEEMEKLQAYYERNQLDMEDLSEAIRQLDAWFENNQHMRSKRICDAKTLRTWPMEKARQTRTSRVRLENAQKPKTTNFPTPGRYGIPSELPEATKMLINLAKKGQMT